MNVASDIRNLMTKLDQNKADFRNKKAVNKTAARLEEAWLWAKEIEPSAVAQLADSCTCLVGAVDSMCPVHGGS